jgi:hypothetical protein
MTANPSLELSLMFKEQMQLNLLPAFKEDFPQEAVTSLYSREIWRDRYKEASPR